MFAYYYLNDSFYNYSYGEIGENLCVGVWHCFTTVFSLGPRSSGSVGDMLIRESARDENRARYLIRYFYDFTVFLIINVCFMNMIFGIIIDSFRELRKEKHTTDHCSRNTCFVCSINRNVLDKEAEGFMLHTKHSHYLWDYLFYVYYLKMKPKTEYNGIETFVWERLQNDDVSWLPIDRSLSLETKGTRKNDKMKEIIGMEEVLKGVVKGIGVG